MGGRLPTEAEWEYAARAGRQEARYGEVGAIGWYKGNSDGKTHPVGTKTANGWGLFDMLGNVWEWVADWYDPAYYKILPVPAINPKGPEFGEAEFGEAKVQRGGSWVDLAAGLRAASRFWTPPGSRTSIAGFRCVREVVP